MSLQLVEITLDVLTSNGPLRYTTRFGAGLNVLAAPNSYGKSTLSQSIVFALELEGMLSASHAPPLGPAMMTVADLPGHDRAGVVESSVTLTCRNGVGRYLRTRRNAVGGGLSTNLIQTWAGDTEAELATANRIDTYVRMPGSAVQELGFHFVLAELPRMGVAAGPSVPRRRITPVLGDAVPAVLRRTEEWVGWSYASDAYLPRRAGHAAAKRRICAWSLDLGSAPDAERVKEELADVRVAWAAAADVRYRVPRPRICAPAQTGQWPDCTAAADSCRGRRRGHMDSALHRPGSMVGSAGSSGGFPGSNRGGAHFEESSRARGS